MIKLVISSGAHPTLVRVFDCTSLVVGSLHSPNIELPLDDELLQDRHVQLVQSEEGWLLINLANDPLATWNGLPFGKRPLAENDSIQIGNTTISFHIVQPKVAVESSAPQSRQQEVLEDVSSLIMQVEALHLFARSPSPSSPSPPTVVASIVPVPSVSVPLPKASIETEEDIDSQLSFGEVLDSFSDLKAHPKSSFKNYYSDEYDGHEENPIHGISDSNAVATEETHSWHRLLRGFAIAVFVVTMLVGEWYLWVNEKIDNEEIHAASVAADVTMALFHAQIRNIHAHNQNWSDVEFIKNNFTDILPHEYSFLTDLDRQGRFIGSPYTLRIYTSPDLSQFLVIAQPLPGFADWLIPRASIVIDSHSMEIRKIKDLKILNRLLVNANTLEGVNAAEISALVKHGDLVSLSRLASKKHNEEFSPPKALALTNSNASRLIYNAPRYYFFGTQLIDLAIEIIQANSNENNVTSFMRELSTFSKFPNLVLYSAYGVQYAVEAQKALNVLAPEEKFLFGYLQFDAQGKVIGAHLLIDDAASEVAMQEPPPGFMLEKSLYHVLARNDGKETFSFSNGQKANSTPGVDHFSLDYRHPIFLHLSGLAAYRQRMLKPICDDMVALLKKNTESLQADFASQFTELERKYIHRDDEQRGEIEKHIETIVRENSCLPASYFIDFVNAADMQAAFNAYLETIKAGEKFISYSEDTINKQLQKIDKSSNWKELHQSVVEAARLLQFEGIPDQEALPIYQSMARSYVIQKLNHFILCCNDSISKDNFTPECRKMLTHILKNAWIVDSDTCDFYVAEFDLRAVESN